MMAYCTLSNSNSLPKHFISTINGRSGRVPRSEEQYVKTIIIIAENQLERPKDKLRDK